MKENGVPVKILNRAADCIRQGGVVAIPTETYYGLAVDPFNRDALARLFQIKERVDTKPILTLIDDLKQLSMLTDSIPLSAEGLIRQFWPGPLTIIFAGRPDLPTALTAGTSTVGARISGHPVPRLLARLCGMPITGTSANISGRPAATTAEEVRSQFPAGIDFIIDGGRTPGGMGSTIVGFDGSGALALIRQGVINFATILETLSSPGEK